jgi:hypothetical protein
MVLGFFLGLGSHISLRGIPCCWYSKCSFVLNFLSRND